MVSSDEISPVRDSNSDHHEEVSGMGSSEAPESGNKHRRPHRKSRLGRQPGKKRKIKCDETRPSCLNCVRREVDCSCTSRSAEPLARAQSGPDRVPGDLRSLLEEQSTKMDIVSRRLSSMESAMAPLAQTGLYQPAVSYFDAAFLSHFFTSTVPTMIVDDGGGVGGGGGGGDFWHVRFPDLNSRHPHVLHLLLGFQAVGHYGEHLQRLSHLVEEITDDGLRGSYVAAMDDLEQFFVWMEGPDVATYYMSPFGWPYRVSDRFLGRIQDKEPLAPAMLSCFTRRAQGAGERMGGADGWADHIMSGIWIYLAPEYGDMVRWPMQRLGWEPGEEDVPLRVALASTPFDHAHVENERNTMTTVQTTFRG
ncbi:Sterol uptake control protein 2 [Colletotrichum shisoi]|uniref:Sterol uptake control protein 2 n=1 Tax=Colletotrichum shisoi TaxID=2078593 RepID=A0A5Q4BNZ7_9PEZI|nr:Sterol uptake control protein 2 [Colletotrichum shisoi]